ncbi:MAG: hypothetical protein H0T72_05795, partial [Chloroflexia bacterium]|nr:hypothetical protein [Chloroflexia bacterium]
MAQQSNIGPFNILLDQFRRGQIDRRRFLTGAGLLGISASAAGVLANPTGGLAQGTPAGTPATALERPAVGSEGQTRGEGDQLRIIWWQAPSLLSPHQNGDSSASSRVIEPLLTYFPGEQLGAVLLDEVPSVENGLLAEDLSTVT